MYSFLLFRTRASWGYNSSLPQEKQLSQTYCDYGIYFAEVSEISLYLNGNYHLLLQDYTETGGADAVVEVLNGGPSNRKTILMLNSRSRACRRNQKRMFVFEDIVTLDNRSIQRVIRDCENEDLLLSMKVSSDEVKNHFPQYVWQYG